MPAEGRAVEDENLTQVNRTADMDGDLGRRRGMVDVELLENVLGGQQGVEPVDHKAHGPLGGMLG